jgi:hypothetical protein
MVVGSVLTWATVPLGINDVAVSGLEANGKITLVLGVAGLALVAAALRTRGRDLPVAAALTGLAAAAIAFAYLRDLRDATAQVLQRFLHTSSTLDPDAVASRFGAHAGPGVWIVLAAGLALAAASVYVLVRDRGEPTA